MLLMMPKAMVGAKTVICGKLPAQINDFEGWDEPRRILVILAHPDDPEFFCGATLIRWAQAGHEIRYCLFTKGQRGSQDIRLSVDAIAAARMREQGKAAELVGAKSVDFLNEMDGELVPTLALRKQTVMWIRKYSPQIIVTSDPQNYVTTDDRLNHPDHRAAGEIVLGAAFPAAGNAQIYKTDTNVPLGVPVSPEEVWISATNQPNLLVDVTNYYEQKLAAICCHESQIGEKEKFLQRMRNRATADPDTQKPIFVERFKRAILK